MTASSGSPCHCRASARAIHEPGLHGSSRTTASQLFFNDQLEQYDERSPVHFNGTIWSMKTAPVFGDTMAYVTAPPSLHTINVATRASVWSANGSFAGMPAVADGAVYASSGGGLEVRDATTGTQPRAYGWILRDRGGP